MEDSNKKIPFITTNKIQGEWCDFKGLHLKNEIRIQSYPFGITVFLNFQ